MTVLQDWVCNLNFMQQSVLIAAVRGPDGIRKDHVSKLLLRWYRRCVMLSAFDRVPIMNPMYTKGGSFTGPSIAPQSQILQPENILPENVLTGEWVNPMLGVVRQYLQCVDEMPHHFQLHFMHAAEILGYKHPEPEIRDWWNKVYCMLVADMHLTPETEADMDYRLADLEVQWRISEVVTARNPRPKWAKDRQ